MSFEYTAVLVGALLFVVGIPLVLKLVPPNPVYGVRTAKTFSSREVWYAADAEAAYADAETAHAAAAAKAEPLKPLDTEKR